jgi:DNA helicase-2/ATP-dependent DNA helicase PcrA
VGITRAEKKLYLTWARYRRRFGGGQPEASIHSRFLKEVPANLIETVRGQQGQVDLYAERHEVRETARRNLYTGKTYNSVENIRQFFAERGMPPPQGLGLEQPARKVAPPPPQVKKKKFGPGAIVEHSKYGRGTVLRLEGSGDDTKLTVSFPGYGLKKLVAKYAGIKIE